MPIVVDASAFVELLLQTSRAAAVVKAVGGTDMVAPDLLNVEVLSVLRKLEQNGTLTAARAIQAVSDLSQTPLQRLPTLPLLSGVWTLRPNVSPYDACYVVAARILGCSLVTADVRLTRAPHLGVTVVVV